MLLHGRSSQDPPHDDQISKPTHAKVEQKYSVVSPNVCNTPRKK